jgi:pyruvate kinase
VLPPLKRTLSTKDKEKRGHPMKMPLQKTKIVCTIGPASDSPEVMKQMIEADMNVARLNFSHSDFAGHKKVIGNLRAASVSLGRRIAIMADLPGPKMRIGEFAEEPIELKRRPADSCNSP